MAYMGLDVGEKRIGVALSDPGATVAIPLKTVERRDTASAITEIISLAREHQVDHLVVGMPFSLRGEIGQQAELVQTFIEELKRRIEMEVSTWDERLSTVAADRLLDDAQTRTGRGRQRRSETSSPKHRRQQVERREHRDAMAAAFILQGFLDRQRFTDMERGAED